MVDTAYDASRQRKIANRRGWSIGSSTGSQRQQGTSIITTLCCNSCRMICYLITNISYVIFYVVLGFACGFVLLVILNLLSVLTPVSIDTNNVSNTYPSTKPTTITDALIQQAAQNNKDKTNKCVIPLGTTVANIKGNGSGQESFQLVVYNDDFLSKQIISNGFWEIRSLDEMAALSPSSTMPKSSMISTLRNGTTAVINTTFYDIGANLGYYSFLFAASGYNVIAFEPEMRNHELFLASMCLNPHLSHRMRLFHYFISDMNSKNCKLVGRVTSRTRKYLYSIPRLTCDTNYKCDPEKDLICQTNITITTLDHFVNQLHPDIPLPHVIKMDVEGQELKILESLFTNNNVRSQGKASQQQQQQRRIEPLMIQYENKDSRYRDTIASLLAVNGYVIGEKHGHDHNTVAEFQPPKMSKFEQ